MASDDSVNIKVNTTADNKGIDSSTESFGKLTGAVAAGQAIYAAASQAISKIGNEAASTVDDTQALGKSTLMLERQLGVTAETASSLIAVTSRFGVDADGASKSFGLLAKQVTAAAQGNKTAEATFAHFGLTVTDSAGKTKDFNTIFGEIADKFKNAPAGMDKTAEAMKLFGRSGKDMIPILNLGSSGIADLEAKAKSMGVVLSQGNVDAIRRLTIAQTDWHESIEGIKISIGNALIPHLTAMTEATTKDVIPAIKEAIGWFDQVGAKVKDAAQKAAVFLTPSFVALGNAVKSLEAPLQRIWKQYLVPLIPIIGATLVLAIALVINGLRILIQVIVTTTNYILNHRWALVATAGALAVLAAIWLTTAIPAAIAWAAAGVAAGIAWLVAAAPMLAIVAIGAALAAIAYEIVTHWSDVKQWFDDFVKWLGSHWEIILGILIGPFGIAVVWIIQNWQRIVDWFGDLKNKILGAIGDAGSWLYNVGKNIVNGLIHGIEDAIGGVGSAIGKVGSDISGAVSGALHKIHIPGFATGGFTGTGGANQVAGVVHKGEYVVPQSQVDQSTGLPKAMGGSTQYVTIGNVYLQTAAASQNFWDNLDQDTINVSRGLTANRSTS